MRAYKREYIRTIVKAREAKGMSQKDLAYFLGVPYKYVYMLEKGCVNLTEQRWRGILDKLAALDQPVHYQVVKEDRGDLLIGRDGTVTLPKPILDELNISPGNRIVQLTERRNGVWLTDSFIYRLKEALR